MEEDLHKEGLIENISVRLQGASGSVLSVWSFMLVLLVGVADYFTGREVSLAIFYLLPISLAAWFDGRNRAMFFCIMSAGVEFAANSLAGRAYSHVLISFWNSAVLMGFFLVYVLILSFLKTEYEKRTQLISELRDSLAQVRRTKAELEEKSQELARSNEDLKEFAYAVSHDLKEPLRSVEGFVKLLARRYKGSLDSKADEFIGYIVDGTRRMESMIKDLLEYSRMGSEVNTFEPVESSAIIQQAVANLRAAIEESGAEVTYEAMPPIMADEPQMVRLFQNLIGNAIKFNGGRSPQVHVSAVRDGEEWVFSVSDNGIGIPPEQAEKIFVIFRRLHTREEYPGSGIGLAVCKKIVERHGGRIWVESEEGKGSTFHVTLPVSPEMSHREVLA